MPLAGGRTKKPGGDNTYEAFAPPCLLAANRAQLMVLIAAGIFGQNTPAIMMTEAQYVKCGRRMPPRCTNAGARQRPPRE